MLIHLLAKAFAAGLLLLHITQFALYPANMNLRTSVAVCSFVAAAVFADRLAASKLAASLLSIFGCAGAVVLISVLHINSRL